ncbi:MAG TPA: trypsin-like peptidase domain-containing protein [Thermoanaerobaculia bacterium]
MNPKPAALPFPAARTTAEPARESLDAMLARRLTLIDEIGNLEARIGRVATESVCGSRDDSQDVELYDGTLGVTREFVMKHQSPVGLLQWLDNLGERFDGPGETPGNVSGVRWGTGALIQQGLSKDLFLTAGHSFDGEGNGWRRPSRNGRPVPARELATSMRVLFNFQVDGQSNPRVVRPGESFPVVELLEHRLSGLDYAIVRLGPNAAGQLPGDVHGTLRMALEDIEEMRTMLCVIQHPGGAPKRVEAGPMTRNVAGRIEYKDLDTLGVSSGAPVLSPAGEIVGVHTNGGCFEFGGVNYGTSIGIIREASAIIRRRRRPS